jgi:hypothetical protein
VKVLAEKHTVDANQAYIKDGENSYICGGEFIYESYPKSIIPSSDVTMGSQDAIYSGSFYSYISTVFTLSFCCWKHQHHEVQS